jgi:hypothetical protein
MVVLEQVDDEAGLALQVLIDAARPVVAAISPDRKKKVIRDMPARLKLLIKWPGETCQPLRPLVNNGIWHAENRPGLSLHCPGP